MDVAKTDAHAKIAIDPCRSVRTIARRFGQSLFCCHIA
ncbi:hypothetical protein BURMUCGD2M_4453 [Burkholderia multivorans CGD2M]|nr:hypothetical protein BURMUCGD2M_4453 [Burkholderia multivorans CGD2M]